jgi:hypothetical protein
METGFISNHKAKEIVIYSEILEKVKGDKYEKNY